MIIYFLLKYGMHLLYDILTLSSDIITVTPLQITCDCECRQMVGGMNKFDYQLLFRKMSPTLL